jgi:hypothetical protein
MEDSIKLPEELLLELRDLKDELMDNVIKIGKLNVQKYFAEKDLSRINNQLNDLYDKAVSIYQKEEKLQNRLISEYGNGKVNFESGIFTKNI